MVMSTTTRRRRGRRTNTTTTAASRTTTSGLTSTRKLTRVSDGNGHAINLSTIKVILGTIRHLRLLKVDKGHARMAELRIPIRKLDASNVAINGKNFLQMATLDVLRNATNTHTGRLGPRLYSSCSTRRIRAL